MLRWSVIALRTLLLLRVRLGHAIYWPGDDQTSDASLEEDEKLIDDPADDTNLFHFLSRPDIGAPKWNIETFNGDAVASGYWFVTPYQKNESRVEEALSHGPHIYRSDGELVWSGAPMFKDRKTWDFRTIDYHGEPALSVIDPTETHESGIILDDGYRTTHIVNMRGQMDGTNLHDFNIIDNGKHVLTLSTIPGESSVEESKAIGFDGECKASWEGFKELNVESNRVTFDWNPHGRIGLNESTHATGSYQKMCTSDWDLLHLNSIDKFPDGDYLLSSRHTDTLYKISHDDGKIIWRLGGELNNFTYLNDLHFGRQHHARVYSQNETHVVVSLLDNAKGNGDEQEPSHDFTRALLVSMNTKDMTAEMLQHYDHPGHGIVPARGGVQFLPNGNALVCFSYGVLIVEFSFDGKVLQKSYITQYRAKSYRAYKFPWVGRPSQPPDVYVAPPRAENNRNFTDVYVSWNGATEVATWKVHKTDFHGSNKKTVSTEESQGFESKLTFRGDAEYIVVEAYDAEGLPLGTSDVVKPPLADDTVDVQAAEKEKAEKQPQEDAQPVPQPSTSLLGAQFALGTLAGLATAVITGVLVVRIRRRQRKTRSEHRYDSLVGDGEYEDEGDSELHEMKTHEM